jgi:hypothetical protein
MKQQHAQWQHKDAECIQPANGTSPEPDLSAVIGTLEDHRATL